MIYNPIATFVIFTLFVGGMGGRITAGRSISGASTPTVVVAAAIVVRVVVRSIAVGVMVAASAAGIGASRGVVVVALAVGSRTSHDGRFREFV
mmetsp:Transcript_26948/g.45913  ORF Transcript_26948/g.45913 Transcript_26948/m.45913 type:complete len:93 (-) Transcript_26948:569-847(-)